MGLIPRFTDTDVQRATFQGMQAIENGIVDVMKYVGETFVRDARNAVNIDGAFPKGDYTDRTANLRASIGFVVLKDGVVIEDGLTGSTAEGTAAAKSAIAQIPKSGYQLIGVAGMEYASYVEAKGYNVITSQADMAIVDLRRLLFKMRDAFSRKGVGLSFTEIGGIGGSVFR
jgi:hypothetical protein